jgi:ketosteroid isomerase-like protein
MSQENVEVVRAAVDAINRQDFDTFSGTWTPDSELDWSRAVGPLHGVWGLDRMRWFWDELMDPWESTRIELDRVIDAGDRVVATQTAHLRGRDGIELKARVTQVWTIRDGRIAHVCLYQDEREALEAVGLSE